MNTLESTFSSIPCVAACAERRPDGSLVCSAAAVDVVKSALADARRELLATRGCYAEIAHIEHAMWLLGGLDAAQPQD